VRFTPSDLELGNRLWMAYRSNRLEELEALAASVTPAFPYLKEVIQAQLDRFPQPGSKGRPERVVSEILAHHTDFPSVFREFFRREGIYGFGDDQVKKIYDRVLSERS
jgi:hypothetical protein